jgi:hypothetical protein
MQQHNGFRYDEDIKSNDKRHSGEHLYDHELGTGRSRSMFKQSEIQDFCVKHMEESVYRCTCHCPSQTQRCIYERYGAGPIVYTVTDHIDYLAQLQKIAKEKRTPDINRPLYIDTAGYFKAECNRLILENNKLEKEISQYKLLADVNIAREAGRAMVEEMSGCLENHGRHEDVVGISNEDPLNTVPRHNLMVYMSCEY